MKLKLFAIFINALAFSFGQIANDTPKCECVPYYQCIDGKIDTTGDGALDERVTVCTGIDVCCALPDDGVVTKKPLDPGPIDPKPVDPFPFEPVDPRPVDPSPNPIDPTPVDPNPQPVDPNPPIYTVPIVTGIQGCGRKRLPGKAPGVNADIPFRISGTDGYAVETFYGEAPWMVRILKNVGNNEEFQCGGSLITTSIVLTAAHCVDGMQMNDLVLRLGEYNIKTTTEPRPHQDRKIKNVLMHPEFKRSNLANDIALIGMDSPVQLSETIDVLCTPDAETKINKKECVALGWGKDEIKSSYQDTLRKVTLPIITREDCQAKMRETRLGKYFRLHPGFICAGGEKEKDTCKGDGGGPLLCPLQNDPDKLVQMGIISWGIECAKGNPTVFASVEHYAPWIRQQIIT